jgi:molybdopterin synthase sulfur carrier subunit
VATVRIPTQLRNLVDNQSELTIDGGSVGEVLKALDAAHPGFGERIFDEGGKLRRFVNVFVDDEDLRFLQGLDTELTDRSVVSIVPAVAGG